MHNAVTIVLTTFSQDIFPKSVTFYYISLYGPTTNGQKPICQMTVGQKVKGYTAGAGLIKRF